MQTIKINDSQTLLDVAIQHCGNVELAYDLAVANGLNFSDDLIIGDEMVVFDVAVEKKKVVEVFNNSKNILVPASKKDDVSIGLEGIGYWAIGVDFIVS
jgi:hypothetical protein